MNKNNKMSYYYLPFSNIAIYIQKFATREASRHYKFGKHVHFELLQKNSPSLKKMYLKV